MRGFMSSIGFAFASIFGMGSFNSIPAISVTEPRPRRGEAKRIRIGGFRYSNNGSRECARRVRQIAAGQLTAANGLAA